jgi:hypothetical protein
MAEAGRGDEQPDGYEAASIVVFRSRHHPGSASWQWVFAVALVRPLTLCMLPLMIAALVTVLQGFPALAYLTIGFPIVLVLALAWTVYRLMTTPAAVFVRTGFAAVRSVWDHLFRKPTWTWLRIFDLRVSRTSLIAGLGDASYVFDRDDWPDPEALLDALRAARDAA